MHASVVAGAALLRAASSWASVGQPGSSVAIFLVYVVYTNIARVPGWARAALALSAFVTAPSGVVQASAVLSHFPPPPPTVVGATHDTLRNSVMTSSAIVREGSGLAEAGALAAAVSPAAADSAGLEAASLATASLEAGLDAAALDEASLEDDEHPTRTVERARAALMAAILKGARESDGVIRDTVRVVMVND
jgi:hypothetical protein